MGTIACLIIYFLGKDFGGKTVGLFSSLFLALSPSFIQRTSVGFFDDETIGMIALLLFTFLFLRAIEKERPISSTIKYSLGSSAALAYFISGWGAAFYPIGLTFLFTFSLILLKRYSTRLLLSFSITFGLGLFIAMNVPYVSPNYLIKVAVLPVVGVFALLCLCELLQAQTAVRLKTRYIGIILAIVLLGGFALFWQGGYVGDVAGKFISVLNPFTRAGSPLIESVAEHRISAWGSIYYELGIGICFFVVGLFFTLRNPNDKYVFLLIFGLTALYFACSMVRLLVLFAPAFSLLASFGTVSILKPFYTLLKTTGKESTRKRYGLERVGKEFSGAAIFLIFLILMTHFAFPMPKVYRQTFSPVTITGGSLPIVPNEPVKEWMDVLKYVNDLQDSTTVVCSWWDYGYWLSILGNVTSLADNATINGTQIENVGFVFMANETQALKMLKRYDAEYVLVFTTLTLTEYSGQYYVVSVGYGDEGKWTWMAKISGKARNRFIADGLLDETSAWTNETKFGNFTENAWVWNDVGRDTVIYKLLNWGKQVWAYTNGVNPDVPAIKPKYFDEAYFAGANLSPTEAYGKYGGIVPLVCLYKINWERYNSDYPT
jgi:dolichyl-diphosphooligosaccharide--protein glycosyltransferase